jgi:hypothetical protein
MTIVKVYQRGVNGYMLTHPRVFHETFVSMELKFSAKIVPI